MQKQPQQNSSRAKNQPSGIASFLEQPGHRFSRLLSFTGLAIGAWLLLSALQVSINVSQLLQEKNPGKDGFDYLPVTKLITNENMGSDNRFTPSEIIALKQKPFLEDVAPLQSNQFKTRASAGDLIPFSTELFLESIRKDFIDSAPASFHWEPGQVEVPVILAADFLEMYNVFATTQELPQFSEKSISAVSFILECYGPGGMVPFKGRIVGVSDRINSVLVPENFLQWANQKLGNATQAPVSRVYIKTKDANNTSLLQYLESNNYRVNKDRTKFGRIKQVLQAIVTGLVSFAVLILLLAIMLFAFYLQLMIARSKENLQLLKMLGYAPKALAKSVSGKWIPVYAGVIITAFCFTQLLQWYFSRFSIAGKDKLPVWIHPAVPVLAILLFVICVSVNRFMVSRSLRKIGN